MIRILSVALLRATLRNGSSPLQSSSQPYISYPIQNNAMQFLSLLLHICSTTIPAYAAPPHEQGGLQNMGKESWAFWPISAGGDRTLRLRPRPFGYLPGQAGGWVFLPLKLPRCMEKKRNNAFPDTIPGLCGPGFEPGIVPSVRIVAAE